MVLDQNKDTLCRYHGRTLEECAKVSREIHGFPEGIEPCRLVATKSSAAASACGGKHDWEIVNNSDATGICRRCGTKAVEADFDFLDLAAVRERLFGDNRTEFSPDIRFLHGAMVKEIEYLRDALRDMTALRDCEVDIADNYRSAAIKHADEIDNLRKNQDILLRQNADMRDKLAYAEKRINEVVLGRVMGSTTWLRETLEGMQHA